MKQGFTGQVNVGVRFIEPARKNWQNNSGRINPTPTNKKISRGYKQKRNNMYSVFHG